MTFTPATPPAGEARDAAFSPLAATLVALVALVAFSGLLVLLAYAPDLRSGDDGGAHAMSRSAVGFAGIAEALRLQGQPVVIQRGALPPGRRSGLLLVTATPATTWQDVDGLKYGGPVLVILPKWLTTPDISHTGWVGQGSVIEGPAISPGSLIAKLGLSHRSADDTPILKGLGPPFAVGAMPRAGRIRSPQFISPRPPTKSGAGWMPMVTDETGAVILARWTERPLYILAEPDLLNTQGIHSIDTFTSGMAILRGLRRGDGPYIFDVTLNGLGRQRSALRLLFDPPFLGVTLCLAVAALLAVFARRFGPIRHAGRAIPLGASALVDNTAALIRLAGKEHRMGGGYAELTGELAARAVGAPRSLGGDGLTTFLDRLGKQRRLSEPLSELSVQARMSQSPEGLLRVARRLYAWRLALTRSELDPEARTGLRDTDPQREEAVP